MGILGRGSGGGGRFKSSPYAVLSMYTIGNRMSLGDAFLNRQIFFGRASVSTFLYYNIYGTVSTFSRSPCGWEVLLSVVPFAVLPWHSLESPVFVYSGGVETINPLHIRINICLHSLSADS
jgi:hypothetical protein